MIKLNDIQANKIEGIYNGIWAVGTLYVEDNFWLVNDIKDLNDDYAIAKRYLKSLLDTGKAISIDIKKNSVESDKANAAINSKTRTKRISFEGKHITKEL